MAHTVVNTVAMDSGIICDGAKASCAAKIAAAVDAGLLGLAISQRQPVLWRRRHREKGRGEHHRQRGRLARLGMAQTDKQIIQLMMES